MKKEEQEVLNSIKVNLHQIPEPARKEVRKLIKLVFIKDTQLSETEEKLKRAYVHIISTRTYIEDGEVWCDECGGVRDKFAFSDILHTRDNCIVLEAQKWLEDKE